MNAKEQAFAIYQQHIALASSDGRLFRRTVMDQMKAEMGISTASAATHYNNVKKSLPAIEGLGRVPGVLGARKAGRGKDEAHIQDDNECFSVLELEQGQGTTYVGRCVSFLTQGDASESFDAKIVAWPKSEWVLIQGLGPVAGSPFELEEGEKEIKRYKA